MSSLQTINGLIVRETPYGEADKILQVLTAEYGKIPVYAKGVRSFRHRYRSTSQLMSYCEFVLYRKNDFYYLKEAFLHDNFYDITKDLERFSLAQYCMEVACDVCVEGEEEGEMLRLLLNTLYLLAQKEKPLSQIKAVFELRTVMENGWMPALGVCGDCATPITEGFLDLPGGVMYCPKCREQYEKSIHITDIYGNERIPFHSDVVKWISFPVFTLMQVVLSAPAKRICAFSASEQELEALGEVSEAYLLHQLERGFSTLDFYHTLKKSYPIS